MPAEDRGRKWLGRELVAAVAVVAVVVAVVAVLIVVGGDDEAGSPGTPPTSDPPSTSSVPRTAAPLAVKIDNVAAARPQTGLGSADVVYVEPVEGGLTRLVAVYYGAPPPPVVGPVRSARRTDIELLRQFGTPVLAYSGAAPELLPALRSARLVGASPAEFPSAFYRNRDRPVPHNLYLRPRRLPGGPMQPAGKPLEFGAVPGGGVATTSQAARFRSARFGFTWSPGDGRWLLSMDGSPLVSTESGRISASTVVLQKVRVIASEVADRQGAVSPVARTVGSGDAAVLRDGRRFTGTWSRPSANSPTTFRTKAGKALSLAAGPVWVLLIPA